MRELVRRFLDDRNINALQEMFEWGYEPTSRQRKGIERRMNRKKNPVPFKDAFTDAFVSDKFGAATTHWTKLQDRVHRGVGNPCPLVLIGLPKSLVTFHEGKAALLEVEAEEEDGEE